jgi:predicted ArsR family transcriptional regulator
MDEERTAKVSAVASLAEPTRRRLYEHVVGQSDPVSRDEAAVATDVPRATVAFHLDKLVDEGLLDVVFERRTGRSGPGAGRPSKLYRRAECDVAVSLPERRYDLAGGLLASAMEEAQSSGESPRAALARRAFDRGRELGRAARDADAGSAGREIVLRVLEEQGFEPRPDDAAVTLANCPFHALAADHTDLVCGMNLQLLDGVLEGTGAADLSAALRPSPGRCCVRLEPAAEGERSG